MKMKKLFAALLLASGMSLVSPMAPAADAKGHEMTGVLIDNQCGGKQKNETAAAKHPIACAKKDACQASGYQLIVGDKHYKLDDKGNEQAKAYLADAKSTHVTVEGTMDGETMKVTSIKAAGGDKK